MCDYSEAEISPIERAFPGITVYICDFHREQAWTRCEQEQLLSNLHSCACASSADTCNGLSHDTYYQQAVDTLEKSPEWQNNPNVQRWLSTTWLCIPQVRPIASEVHSICG